MKKLVELNHVTYRYDQRKTDGITNMSLAIKKSECVCLIGPSGSGKSTTAKLIAELIHPQEGSVKFFENVKTAYVPQNTQLPEDKTVMEYLLDSLSYLDDDEKKETLVRTNLLLLNISNETHSPISAISGGQRQRVIIAAALVQNPNLIILDEPFGHLDEKLRGELMEELFSLFKDQSIACLWVTHETKEALSFSDRIILLNFGVVQQDSSSIEIYQQPTNMFTADFFGKNNSILGKLISVSDNDLLINLFNKEIVIPKPEKFKAKDHQDVLLIIRPENINITNDGDFSGKITTQYFQGAFNLLELVLNNGYHMWMYAPGHIRLNKGEKLKFSIEYSKVYCLDEV